MTRTRIYILAGALFVFQAGVLFWLGQPLISESGTVKLWHGVVLSGENSQQLSDWYTFSHIIHGFLFYALLTLLFPRTCIATRFAIAVGLEAGWEILENTPLVIEAYRAQALAQGYSGDSILNSLSDTIAMAVGFLAARKFPLWGSIVAVLVLEAIAMIGIHDGLLLNILGFVYTPEFISNWQSAGGLFSQ